MIAQALAETLGRAAVALEAGDALAAAAAMSEAGRACQQAADRGERVEAEALAALSALHARCGRGVASARATLDQALESVASARRAAIAYRVP